MTLLFSGWESLLRTLVVGTLTYVVLVAVLRISGKRTLSKMNAFDLVVTVAIGSTLASAMLDKGVMLADAAFAVGLLVALQFAVTWSSIRWPPLQKFVKAEPVLIARGGEILEGVARRERVTKEEVFAAVRQSGNRDLSEVQAVMLETDGTFSVISGSGAGSIPEVEQGTQEGD